MNELPLFKLKTAWHPGETVPRSGQYDIINPDSVNTGYQITGVKGKQFPPQRYKGCTYRLSDPTTHQDPYALRKLLGRSR